MRNLLNGSFGTAFVTSKIKVSFPSIRDEICQIDIQPSTKPLVISVKDKNGQPQEKFYVRSGNSSQELSLNEMPAYL